jgi:hypothetical protein
MRLHLILLAMLAGATPAVAAAPDGPSTATAADARCLLTMAALTNTKDANTARSAQIGVVYFAGRLKARDPAFDFTSRLKTVAASLDPKGLPAEVQRCGPMVETAMKQLDAGLNALAPPPAAKK